MNSIRSSVGLCLLAGLSGCTHLGPSTIAVDRFDYSSAIADSWKQQTLLNIVKLRYMDLPVFVDVASVVTGYSMETTGSLGGSFATPNAVSPGGIMGSGVMVGGQARFTDRPTITYAPMTGERFLRALITPLDPKKIFFMLQAGYPADFILGLTVESINGVRNRATAGGAREADASFLQVLKLLREIQAVGAVGMRIEEDKSKGETAVLFFRRDDLSPDILEKTAEFRRLLKLPPDSPKLMLTYSPVGGAENELAVNSRSMLQIMAAFGTYMDVPEAHLKEGRARPAFEGDTTPAQDAVRIHSGASKPSDTFAAVEYRGYWYWIDDRDWQTKRALTAVMFFFTLAEGGGNEKLPLITIPAQ